MYSVIAHDENATTIGRSTSLLACRLMQLNNVGSIVVEEHVGYDEYVPENYIFIGPSFQFSQFVTRVDIYLSHVTKE